MAKVHLLEVEVKHSRLELVKTRYTLMLSQENQKIDAAAAAAATSAASVPPALEVETVIRNSVASLGQDVESGKGCCAGSKCCIADDPDLEPLQSVCLKCKGKAHQEPCSNLPILQLLLEGNYVA